MARLLLNAAQWDYRRSDLATALYKLRSAKSWLPKDSQQYRDLGRLIRSTSSALRHAELRHTRALNLETHGVTPPLAQRPTIEP